MKPDSATVKPVDKPAGKPRNLTNEGIRAHVEQMKVAAMNAVPAYAVSKVHLPKVDPKTKQPIRDADGFVELIEKVVLQRDLIAAEWDDKLSGLEG